MKIIELPKSPKQSKQTKQPKINPYLIKFFELIITTIIIWLLPESTIAIALIKLLFFCLEWLTQKGNKNCNK